MSYAQYLEFAERAEVKHEFIDGHVVAMAGGSIEHSRLAARMGFLLQLQLEGRPCNVFNADARVRIEATNRATYPDVTVVCGPVAAAADDRHAITNPTVLVEVLSDATERDDRGSKFAHYRRLSSLREYVLVAQDRPCIEVFRRDAEGWTLREYGPGDQVALPSLECAIEIDQLYRDPTRAAARA